MFSHISTALLPKSVIAEEEMTILASISDEKKITISFEGKPLYIDVFK